MELAHKQTEAEMSHNLQLASWRPERVGGIIPVWLQGLRTRIFNGVSSSLSSSAKAGENKHLSLKVVRQRGWIIPSYTFLYEKGLQWIGWGPPTLGRAICFPPSIGSNVNLIQKHPHRHIQKNVWPNIGHSVTQSSWDRELTLTTGKTKVAG